MSKLLSLGAGHYWSLGAWEIGVRPEMRAHIKVASSWALTEKGVLRNKSNNKKYNNDDDDDIN